LAADPEQLFAQGAALMAEGKFEEALPKLEQAQKQDPGIGTLFNIAVCKQNLNRLGTAYRNFREVVTLARASGKKAREDAAKAKLEEVKALAPAFAISSDDKDVSVRIDGEMLTKEDWAYYPVDGTITDHMIEASAPTKKGWTTTLATPAAPSTQAIVIPTLEVVSVTVTKETTNTRRTLAYVFGGIGAAGFITAGITGGLMASWYSSGKDGCKTVNAQGKLSDCTPEAADDVNALEAITPINYAAFAVGGVGLAAGIFFFVWSLKSDATTTSPSPSPKASASTNVSFVPRVDPRGGAGASISGTF